MTSPNPHHAHPHPRAHELEDHDRGLTFDLQTLLERRAGRRALVAGAGAVGVVGLGSTAPARAARLTQIPEETAGPFPGDGSNGPDVLDDAGVVRRDIRSSFDGASGRAVGFPFLFSFALRRASNGLPVQGLAVYAWHCDRDGRYSMYSSGVTAQNYLRGVQVTNVRGVVTFRSIYPGCYSGRWPHVHFEVYRTKRAALTGGTILRTSQIALPRSASSAVYRNVDGYEQSITNLSRVSLATDAVFGDDDGIHQRPSMGGSLAQGFFHARLTVPIAL